MFFAATSIYARRNLSRILGCFEQTIPTYSLDEFKSHFRMQRSTCEIVVREVMATGNISAGNPFGRQVIDPRKQVLIFLWCMANQETTRLVADRFNVRNSREDYRGEHGTGIVYRMIQKFPGNPVKSRKRKYLERYYLFSGKFPPE